MDLLFFTKKLVSALILPPTAPLLIAVAGLLLLRSRPRLGRGLVWAGVLSLVLLAWSPVAFLLTRTVAVTEPLDLERAREAQAIVIVASGLRYHTLEYGGEATLSRWTLERVRYGAYLARRTGLPVLVTGGIVFTGPPEAEIMRDALERDFGVPVRWAETRSRDTHENAIYSAPMLSESGIDTVVLVAHADHMGRARREFTSAGIHVIAAPIGDSGQWSVDHPLELLPSMSALSSSYRALYEILASLAGWLGLLGSAEPPPQPSSAATHATGADRALEQQGERLAVH